MTLRIEMDNAIRLLIEDRGIKPLDLYEIVAILQGQFPTFTAVELAQRVANEGVTDGARFLSWELPEGRYLMHGYRGQLKRA